MKLTDFDIYKDLLKEKSGLIVTPDKSYLLESRLTPVAKKWGLDSIDALTAAMRGVPDQSMVKDIIEAMTTNETSFFRDQNPFNNLRDVALPYILQHRIHQRKFRLWCAAASSGQEPYTISMVLKELGAQFSGWNTEIIGTDISEEILEQAKNGFYSQFEVQRGMPVTLLVKYFKQDGDRWQINEEIRNMVKYQYLNLLESFINLGTFDIVFCRNVLIYFDEATKKDILERIAKQMPPDGFLFLGGAETVLGLTDAFQPMPNQRGLYVLNDSPHLEKAA